MLDWVEIRTVRRQEEQLRARFTDRLTNRITFVAAKIVHDHDVVWFEAGPEDVLDIMQEALAVDGAVKDARGINPVMTQGCNKGHGLPVPVRHMGDEPLAFATPAP